jgi:hypothetical protein
MGPAMGGPSDGGRLPLVPPSRARLLCDLSGMPIAVRTAFATQQVWGFKPDDAG